MRHAGTRADLVFKLKKPPGIFHVDVRQADWRIVSPQSPPDQVAHLNQTLERIRHAHPGTRFSRVFPLTVQRLREIDGHDRGDREIALFFVIAFPGEPEAYDVVEQLREEPLAEIGEILSEMRDTCTGAQEYIQLSTMGGVGATWAWSLQGGNGGNVTICVVDGGWDQGHPDLPQSRISYVAPPPVPPFLDHGTNVLGVLVGMPTPVPLTGVAFASRIKVSSTAYDASISTQASGTLQALDRAVGIAGLAKGDVLLVEQVTKINGIWEPLEASWAMMHLFEVAADLGITVVEPAGNTNHEVGNPATRPPWPSPLLPISKVAGDKYIWGKVSALRWPVMVGAGQTPFNASSGLGPVKKGSSNYGARVDCQSWGACVKTTLMTGGAGGFIYKDDFGDTSAAAAIIAGVVAIIQSTRIAVGLQPLSPHKIRMRLRNNNLGLPQPPADEALHGHIGPQPDLKKILYADYLPAYAYSLRPFLDYWVHHPWVSPHIFPRRKPLPEPGPFFGDMASWRDDPGETIAPSERGVVYLRLLNESPFEEPVCADLYWAHPGTYLGPSSWLGNSIGRVEMQLPRGREEPGVAVSPGIPWIAPATTTDPSLIAVFTSRWDETPLGGYSPDADYIATVHRVAHRNVIRLPHAEGPWFWRFRLRLPRMALRSTTIRLATDLPEGTRLYIGLPPGREGTFQMDASTARYRGDALLEMRFGANTELALERMWKPGGDLMEADRPPEVWLECDASRPSFPGFGLRPGEEVPIVIGVERLERRRSATITVDHYATFPSPIAGNETKHIGRLVLATPAAGS